MSELTANLEYLTHILVDQLGVEPSKVTPESNIITDLGADSLDGIDLVMAAEEDLGINITDEEAAKMEAAPTVKDILALLQKIETAQRP